MQEGDFLLNGAEAERVPSSPRRPRSRGVLLWAKAAGLVAALCVGTAVRIVPWDDVFTSDGVRFAVDTDPHYHVLRVRNAIAEGSRVAPRDPWLDYPNGVEVVWPPLFDEVMLAAARLVGEGHPAPELVERVAALFPVALGVATVAVVASLGSAMLGGGLWLDAALLLALLPVHARFSMVGRPDQHVAEVLVFCCVLLAFIRSWKKGPRLVPTALLGLSLCVAFWTWQGSALNLAVLALVVSTWHIIARPEEPTAEDMARGLALGAAGAAILLALSLASFGPPGAISRMSLAGLSGFPVLLCALVAAFAGGLVLSRRRWPLRSPLGRALQAMGIAAAAALPLAIPAMWPPLRQGAMAFARSGRWYSTISEFSPLFGQYRFNEEFPYRFAQFGFTLLVAPFALVPVVRAWRQRPLERDALCVFITTLGLFFTLALLRVRFGAYLAPLLAIAVALVVRAVVQWLAARGWIRGRLAVGALTAAGVVLVATPTPAHIREGLSPEGLGMDETLLRLLRRLETLPPAVRERPAVLARWPIGHLIRYYAGKPVVTNGFGIEGGEHSLDDWAAFAFATEEDSAERILEARRIGFLVVGDPAEVIEHDLSFAPEGTRPVVVHAAPGELRPLPAFYDLEITRLAVFNGSGRPGHTEAGLGHYRLLEESLPGSMTSALKVFGWVPGCRVALQVGAPGVPVRVVVHLTSNLGRPYDWQTSVETDSGGHSEFLLPYATGANGYVRAAPYEVTAGSSRAGFLVPESCVALGGLLALDMRPEPSRAAR